MAIRLNPPPGWPPAPAGWTPPPGWQPDPSWPPPPPGWPLWVDAPAPDGRPAKRVLFIVSGSVLAVIAVLAVIGAIADGGGSGGGSSSATSILRSGGYTEFPAADPNSVDAGPFATATPATYAADVLLPFQAAYLTAGGSEASGYTGSASSPAMMQDVVILPGNGMTMMKDEYIGGIPGLQREAAASGVAMSVSGDVVTITGTAAAFDTLATSGGDF